jgi:hypothetical protein
MIRYKYDSLGKSSFDSTITHPLDFILHTLISADNNRSRREPMSAHPRTNIPLRYSSNRDSKALFRI